MTQNPPADPLDRFGQPLQPGDIVTYQPDPAACYRVAKVVPDLRPNARPGTLFVYLTADLTIPVPAATPIPGLTRVGYMDPFGQPVIGSVRPRPTADPAQPGPGPRPVD